MRYIADSNGYLQEVSFGADIVCGGSTCTEYTGSVPSGYTSLEAWYLSEADKLYRWKVVDGELTLDSSAAAPVDSGDYVVEQGTSGIWTYRKFASGIAECWGVASQSSVACTKAWGSIYSSNTEGNRISATFPFTFKAAPVVQATPFRNGADFWLCTYSAPTTTTTGGWQVLRGSSSTIDVKISFHAIGRWK